MSIFSAALAEADQSQFIGSGMPALDEFLSRAALPRLSGLEALIQESLIKHLGHSNLDIIEMADILECNKRTLQRRLSSKGTSFHIIRDQVRFHYSIELLLHSDRRMGDISDYLGFGDPTSFTTAFHRWTQMSPTAFRTLHLLITLK